SCDWPATPASPWDYGTTAVTHTGRSIYFMPPDMQLCDFAGALGASPIGFSDTAVILFPSMRTSPFDR
ncbi:hypothetical protein, partial [Rhodococcus zopfii]|uniref:hypothetical protein n=1 Tax=Rhodococcus zopfii TaxID=43772 RepID=UPI001EDCA5BF